jgi:hypothetical protein
MSGLNVDLLWQRRHRGLVSIGAATLDDSGNALLIKPDEFESRTYQVLRFSAAGDVTELAAVSVERVQQWVGSSDGRFLIGVTADDVYLFRDGKKARFMTDRRATYADVALAPEAGWFVCGFSDEVFATYGIAYGDANGRLGWTRDLSVGVNRVALSRDGKSITIALADGTILATDSTRVTLWEHALDENITAVAMSAKGGGCVAGTDQGTVRALSGDGVVRWSTSIGVPIVAAALSDAADFAAVAASEGSTHLIVGLDDAGNPVWEYQLEGRPAGISCSPNGRHLLVITAGGEATCFAVEGAGTASSSHERTLEEARRLLPNDPVSAWELIAPAAAAAPHLPDVAAVFLEARGAALSSLQREAASALEKGDAGFATTIGEIAARVDPWDPAVFALRGRCREARIEERARAAESAELLQDLEGALAAWSEVVGLDAANVAAREGVRRVRSQQAEALMQVGDRAEAAGRIDEALAAWKDAQRLSPSEALGFRITEADARRCLQLGIAHYEAQRLPEATFQLKKSLSLDPDNEEARRYLGYVQGQSGDSGIADRFARLE